MSITTDELRILLKINGASSYTTTINQITNVTKNYESTVGKLMATMIKLVTTGAIAKFSKQCIEAASNLQEVANVVNVTFGKTAAAVNDWAKSNAASFGLSQKAALEYAGRYGTMAKQFNFTTDQATKMAIELTKLSGDVASFYNISDSSAANKLKAVFTGETESLKELGVVMTQTQLDAYAMTKGWNKTTKDMTEQEKVALRYSYTMEKLAHAQGDFMRTSDGYANSVRSMKLELENMKIEIGNELLPVAAQGIQFIVSGIKAISPVLKSIAHTVHLYSEAWKNASEKTKNFAKAALACFAIMAIAPAVIKVVRGAVRLLTIDILTLKGALGLLGMIFSALAFKELTDQVKQMKADGLAEQLGNIGDSAEISSDAVDDLSGSLDGLGNSAKGLETFLASFDEVNKVGGGSSLMSNLVTIDDLNNIFDAVGGIDDLQNSLNSIELPTFTLEDTIFSKQWWIDLGKSLTGFIDTIGTDEFWENWKLGMGDVMDAFETFDSWLEEHMPHWHDFFDSIGQSIWDLSHDKNGNATTVGAMAMDALLDAHEYDSGETFTYTNRQGKQVEVMKYGADGRLSKAYEEYIRNNVKKYAGGGYPDKGSLFLAGERGPELIGNFGSNQTRVVNQSQMGSLGGQQPVINFNPTITMDGEKVSRMVANHLNNMMRSGSDSPLMSFE